METQRSTNNFVNKTQAKRRNLSYQTLIYISKLYKGNPDRKKRGKGCEWTTYKKGDSNG